ncbi:MAG: ferrous iron transport protein A [Alphaproteobacteria bacterium]|nr:MAG: ferrous iron transport protein A [Alphaproteobacteria bacterium]
MTLDHLQRGESATIIAIDWGQLAPEEARRLRALGIDEGAEVSIAHRGVFGGPDPIALVIGRTTVAIRRAHAAAMQVRLAGDAQQ